jgi:F-type H+-transporting ATPase subunit delta
LQEILGEMLQKKVVLEVKVDPEIMGGIVVRVGDQVIDGSVRMRLLGLRQRLAQQAIT